jgi:RNA polymerase-binding protein DksA
MAKKTQAPVQKSSLDAVSTAKDAVTQSASTPPQDPAASAPSQSKRASSQKVKENAVKKTQMSPERLQYFKEKLQLEKQRVLNEVNGIQQASLKQSISDQSGENSRYSYHLGDVASISYGREFTMGLAERQQKYLEQVDDALQRIDDGTYGICRVTEEAIPEERLEEVPVAKYSVKGKEILEQRKRQGLA